MPKFSEIKATYNAGSQLTNTGGTDTVVGQVVGTEFVSGAPTFSGTHPRVVYDLTGNTLYIYDGTDTYSFSGTVV